MTIEQELQAALRAAFQTQLHMSKISAAVIAEKLPELDGEPRDEEYPAIVIVTSTPVPDGYQSPIISVPLFVRAMSYLADARTKREHAELCDIVFRILQHTDSWSIYETHSETTSIGGVTIDAGEEPLIEGGALIIQETRCTIDACYHPGG